MPDHATVNEAKPPAPAAAAVAGKPILLRRLGGLALGKEANER
jgi:hypothetical protein